MLPIRDPLIGPLPTTERASRDVLYSGELDKGMGKWSFNI